ncbi:MAG TPA: cytochrome c peroxidase [Polyangiaceae bacterium]|nr:cytochrome c peroxidase [Polyangiaceae bacterium]
MPTKRRRGRATLLAASALASLVGGGAVWGAPPAQPPQPGTPKPPAPNAANPAATSNQAAPSHRDAPGARIASGGGNAPHGALPMDRQRALLAAAQPPRPPEAAPGGIDPAFWKAIVPADNAMSDARVALGRKLYFDPRLSRDGTVACATCHDVGRGFADRRGTSEGIGDKIGQRNAPTVLNAALFQAQFWDGRAATLEDQAKLPITNPIEMGMADEKAAVAPLKADPEYQRDFQAAYGRAPNFDDVGRALAAFERTLVFVDAPFDRFLAGDPNAVDAEAKAGWVLFNGKARCNSCHQMSSSSPVGTDNRFHNVGVAARHRDFEALAKKALDVLAKGSSKEDIDRLALQTDLSELGRFVVTRNRGDVGAFKTSQVRNVGITAPYMHDGSLATLWDVVDHYNKGGESNPYLDGGIEPLALNEREVDQLVAYLFALTDVRFAADNRAEFERQRQLAARQRPHRDDAAAQRRVLPFERRATGAKVNP